MILSSARAGRDPELAKDQDPNREKARAVRARQRVIGRELRRIYDGVVSEPVPDDFLDLLRRIDETDATAGNRTKKSS
jgi:hypothetical protein